MTDRISSGVTGWVPRRWNDPNSDRWADASESITDVRAAVSEYYGKILNGSKDLKTSSCCLVNNIPPEHIEILKTIEPEIMDKFYGCGSPIPCALEGCTVLDLGCGSGRDVYVASKLVGENGFVIGIDMTEEQLEVAERNKKKQMEIFGFKKSNVDFRKGYIEDLSGCGIEDNSVDVVISNCVINLSPDKPRVFSEIFRVLKPGGELYFSDVFSSARISEEARMDPVLYGECLSGAMYINDFRRLLRDLGCTDYRIMSSRAITVDDASLRDRLGCVEFYSVTVRTFKLASLEDVCEDYGQVAYYLGTIPGQPNTFRLDERHLFIKNKPTPVCGNTAAMIGETRLAPHFNVVGDRRVHYGVFQRGPAARDVDAGSCC